VIASGAANRLTLFGVRCRRPVVTRDRRPDRSPHRPCSRLSDVASPLKQPTMRHRRRAIAMILVCCSRAPEGTGSSRSGIPDRKIERGVVPQTVLRDCRTSGGEGGTRRGIRLMQPGCQGNCSLRCGRQSGHAPSTSNSRPTTMNTRVTKKPARKCGGAIRGDSPNPSSMRARSHRSASFDRRPANRELCLAAQSRLPCLHRPRGSIGSRATSIRASVLDPKLVSSSVW
jgi:hypothetical protein